MNWKQFLQSKGLSESDYAAKEPKEMADLSNEFRTKQIDDLQAKIDKAAKPEDVTAIKQDLDLLKTNQDDAIKDLVKSTDFEELKTKLEDAEAEILSLKQKGVDNPEKDEVLEAIVENKEKIEKSIHKNGDANFIVKTNVTRASVANSTQAMRIDSIGQLAHRRFVLRDLFPVIPVGEGSNGVIRYADWNDTTKARAAEMVAEGAQFPESTAAWAEYSLDLKKIGDSIPVTEETLYDAPRFARELENFLNVNVSIVEDDQLYDGDGNGQNIFGVYTRATTYAPVASSIQDASIYDLCVKVAEVMTNGKRSKYNPNFVMMNITDINKMRLKKDADNNYIMPPFVGEDGRTVISMTVIESNAVTANTMLVGDSRYGTIYEVEGYNVTTGWVNDQFTADLMTLKAKKRMAMLVREADREAFYKVEDITAALITLAS